MSIKKSMVRKDFPRFSTSTALFLLGCIYQDYRNDFFPRPTPPILPRNLKLVYSSPNLMFFQSIAGEFYLTFRSALLSSDDFLRNFTFNIKSTSLFPEIGDVHSGFIDYYDRVIRPEIEAINLKYALRAIPKLYITGHGVGAAYASLCGLDLARNLLVSASKMEIYTFGSPKVGGLKFKAAYNLYGVGASTFRVFNNYDLFPLIPFGKLSLNKWVIDRLTSLFSNAFLSVPLRMDWENYLSSEHIYAHVGNPIEINLVGCGVLLANRFQISNRSHQINSGYFTPLFQTLSPEEQTLFILNNPPGFWPPILEYCKVDKHHPFQVPQWEETFKSSIVFRNPIVTDFLEEEYFPRRAIPPIPVPVQKY